MLVANYRPIGIKAVLSACVKQKTLPVVTVERPSSPGENAISKALYDSNYT